MSAPEEVTPYKEHAIVSASGAETWWNCAGSVGMQNGIPEQTNEYAEEGTLAHTYAAELLARGSFHAGQFAQKHGVPTDMVRFIRKYTGAISERADRNILYVEERLPLTPLTGEPDAFGTADALILNLDEETIEIHDLKYGYRAVDVVGNKQLLMYAAAAYLQFEVLADWKAVVLGIHQPRVGDGEPSVTAISIQELRAFIKKAKVKAEAAYATLDMDMNHIYDTLNPGDVQCKWCRAAAQCPALDEAVEQAIEVSLDGVADINTAALPLSTSEHLGTKLAACDLVERWVDAVRDEARRRLSAGLEVPGHKLVVGRKGVRTWVDEEAAALDMRSMRLKQEDIYQKKIITISQLEKLLKERGREQSGRVWNRILANVSQKDGVPTVAKLSDKRPAIEVGPQFPIG